MDQEPVSFLDLDREKRAEVIEVIGRCGAEHPEARAVYAKYADEPSAFQQFIDAMKRMAREGGVRDAELPHIDIHPGCIQLYQHAYDSCHEGRRNEIRRQNSDLVFQAFADAYDELMAVLQRKANLESK